MTRRANGWAMAASLLMVLEFVGALAVLLVAASERGDAGGYGIFIGGALVAVATGTSLLPAIFVLRGRRSAMTAAMVLQLGVALLVADQAFGYGSPQVAVILPLFAVILALLLKARAAAPPEAVSSPADADEAPARPRTFLAGVVAGLCTFQLLAMVLNAVAIFSVSPSPIGGAGPARIPSITAACLALACLIAALARARGGAGALWVVFTQVVFCGVTFFLLQPWSYVSPWYLTALAGFVVPVVITFTINSRTVRRPVPEVPWG